MELFDDYNALRRYKNQQGLNRATSHATSAHIAERQLLAAIQNRLREIIREKGMRTYCAELDLPAPPWIHESDTISVRANYYSLSARNQRRVLNAWEEGDENQVFTKLLREAMHDSRNFLSQ